jgi:hypothetical protein
MKKSLLALAVLGCLLALGNLAHARGTPLDGKWHFVFDTPDGDREADADFTVSPEGAVTGKLGPADVAGTFKDGQLKLDFQITESEAGAAGQLKLDGKVNADALTGSWEFESYGGTFRATRPKP